METDMQKTLALMVALALPLPVAASDFLVVSDRGEFLSLVQDRELRLAMLGLSLSVKPDGTIEGQALGSEVTGTWAAAVKALEIDRQPLLLPIAVAHRFGAFATTKLGR
ncbi:MAG: hypothetical protein B7Z31_13340 [Rhodobacterales bacterium 12-65-15]|nr:MAG: hypothetical protein B7Z31_13340 [Rhodobacterales bacterium 12-65-15]